MKVSIVGAGIMGTSLAYFLTRAGVEVEVFEATANLAGLAGPVTLPNGVNVDRFYHTILSSDAHLRDLISELGLSEKLRARETKSGFFYQGQIHPMNNIVEFFRFPPLGWVDRLRLGVTVAVAQLIRDWNSLEGISVEEWLLRWSGSNTYQNIWRPLLKAKFDGQFTNVPATWIWARLVRMKSTRDGASQKEQAGHLIGGYPTLLEKMADFVRSKGNRIHLETPVEEISIHQGHVAGLRVDGTEIASDVVISTVQTPILSRLLPRANPEYRDHLRRQQYLGVICPLLVLDSPLTGFWTVNITDDSIPFTGVIETTAYIDPVYVGGHHLVYLPKYTMVGSEWWRKSDEEIKSIWLDNLRRMFPTFDAQNVRYFLVNRAPYVEPLHGLNSAAGVPSIESPVTGLYLSTTAQIYPSLTNGESVTRHARQVANLVLHAARLTSTARHPSFETSTAIASAS